MPIELNWTSYLCQQCQKLGYINQKYGVPRCVLCKIVICAYCINNAIERGWICFECDNAYQMLKKING